LLASLWRRYSQPSLARKTTATRPDIKKWFVEGIDDKLFQSASLSRTAQQLHKHINIPSTRLDIMATLEKTLQAGGWLKPVMATMKSRPEYLVLIDRTTFNDHQAEFINSLINQIVAENVFITRYYFDAAPRRCYPEKKELPPRTLTELAQHYPTHRLMIFSDGNGFINPITGELVQWIEQLSIWLQRVLFTLETPAQWGYREQILDAADFLILPANEAGLTALAEQINIGTWQPYPAPSDSYAPAFPDYLNERPRRWLERHAPDAPMLTELLKQVRDFLGEDGYYWFSACAVYPEIRWQLTVYLGYQLNLLTEERFAKLARLPWFRYGNMPNWLRRRLVDDLSLEQEKAIRTELNILWAKASDKPISDFCLEIAREQKARLSKLGKRLLSQWIKYSPKNSPLRDYVFLSFMPDRLAVKMPAKLKSWFKKDNNEYRWQFATVLVGLLTFAIVFFFMSSLSQISPKSDLEKFGPKQAKPESVSTPEQYSQVALVIGNSQYEYAPLKTPVNDAKDITKALEKLGFHVFSIINANQRQMKKIFQRFAKRLSIEKGVGLFYFSGHGVGVSGVNENYLIPIDNAQIRRESDVTSNAISVGNIVESMKTYNRDSINIIILDAARTYAFSSISKTLDNWKLAQGMNIPVALRLNNNQNNWFGDGFQKVNRARGMIPPSINRGTVIFYSADYGEVVLDVNERNSLFTKHLLKVIHTPHVRIEDML
jgi:hypothetical protein